MPEFISICHNLFAALDTTKVGDIKLLFYDHCQGSSMIFITFCRFCAILRLFFPTILKDGLPP
ncbi:hypothetical protein [Hugenholtzia roseola]|uniref:hypothetical protein n=1 Tax=Hugenholtzia roseola TaxID=1002 RepID=UPI000401034E|nr:hypothetical protein [Hugenholtzia roseola]